MKDPQSRHRSPAKAATALVAALIVFVSLGWRERNIWGSQATPAPQSGNDTSAAGTLHVLVGRSLVITSQARISRVSVADPAIVDAQVVSPTQILINGKAPGVASVVIWDETGQSQTYDANVDIDVTEIAAKLHALMPGEPVQVEARGGVVTLSGIVSSQAVADRVLAVTQAMSPRKEGVVSLLQIPPPRTGEVLLEVKFADVDRSTLTQWGTNFLSTSPAKNVFTTSTGQYSAPSIQQGQTVTGTSTTTLSSAVSSAGVPITLATLANIFIFRPDINLGAVIQALEEKNLVQILAEPNVMAENGKEASFLDGGQFPFPVVQGSTGGVPVVTIQFREYGVKLSFTPVITPEGTVHLKVFPEVSSLDYTNSLTIQGFTIPSIATRSVQSEMTLRDGQSFVIAGLLNKQDVEQFQKMPGLGDIPLFGQLFRSRSVSKSDDELLILVTPHIVNLQSPPKILPMPPFPDTFLGPIVPARPGKPPVIK